MTDKEVLDWMDENHRGVWWNPRSGYWAIQDEQKATTPVPTPVRVAIEATVNSEPTQDS